MFDFIFGLLNLIIWIAFICIILGLIAFIVTGFAAMGPIGIIICGIWTALSTTKK